MVSSSTALSVVVCAGGGRWQGGGVALSTRLMSTIAVLQLVSLADVAVVSFGMDALWLSLIHI